MPNFQCLGLLMTSLFSLVLSWESSLPSRVPGTVSSQVFCSSSDLTTPHTTTALPPPPAERVLCWKITKGLYGGGLIKLPFYIPLLPVIYKWEQGTRRTQPHQLLQNICILKFEPSTACMYGMNHMQVNAIKDKNIYLVSNMEVLGFIKYHL